METKKRILIISEVHLIKTFVQPTVEQLKKETEAEFDCFIVSKINDQVRNSLLTVFKNVYSNEYPKGMIANLPKIRLFQTIYGLRKLARSLDNYDIVHIYYHNYYYSYFTPIIRDKTRKFYLMVFGSDFNERWNMRFPWPASLRADNFRRIHNQKTINLLDGLFATNEVLLRKIISTYNLSGKEIKTGILIPLMNSFKTFREFLQGHTDHSAKKLLGLNKKVIACGYNAAPIVRHEMIIEALLSIRNKLSDFKIIFPMTYGWRADGSRKIVEAKLKGADLDSIILKDYLTIEQLQALRLAADIFIHIQSRDQMAASMLEHMAAGTVVITGKWLPYSSLAEKGVYFIAIDKPSDLAGVLEEVIVNLDLHKNRCRVNREIILNMLSWDAIKENWYACYELEKRKERLLNAEFVI